MDEEVHHRGGDEINMIQRLAQQNDIFGQVVYLAAPSGTTRNRPASGMSIIT